MCILIFSALWQGNMRLLHHFSITHNLDVGLLNFMGCFSGFFWVFFKFQQPITGDTSDQTMSLCYITDDH